MKLWPWIRNLFSAPSQPESPVATFSQPPQHRPHRSRLALRLERRLMFDGAGVLTVLAAMHHDAHGDGQDAAPDGDFSTFGSIMPHEADNSPKEIIFVDPRVADHQTLLQDLPDSTRVVVLNPNQDGIAQIRQALSGHAEIEAVHIVSHGSPGRLTLGSATLDLLNVDEHAQTLQEWGTALSEQADILIYGCDVASGMTGSAFVQRLGELTGADVAASTDLTGSADQGGDWELEQHQGTIDTPIFPSEPARLAFHGVLPSANPIIANLNSDVLAYTEDSGALVIDQGGNVTVTDTDSPDFNGGTLTVAISANRDATEDQLAIRNQGAGAGQIGVAGANVTYQGTVIGTFTGGTGTNNLVITFNANADPVAVSALLKNITYTNTDTVNPTNTTRSITFSLTDGDGGATTSTTTATVTRVNDTPTISGGATLNYTENNTATVIDATITIGDVDSTTLSGATITISSNFQSGADLLSFTNTANITGSWNAVTGTLTLTGADTLANYQAALRTVKYQNTSDAPTTLARSVSFQVTDGTTTSTPSIATVNITGVNDAPVLTTGTQWFVPPVIRNQSDATNTGATVGSLFAASDITDGDATPLEGVAIYSRHQASVGTWQYSIDSGTSWIDVPPNVSSVNALLLRATDKLRFVPNNSDGGQPTLYFYAWDQTSGVAGTQVNAATRGGTTAFSSNAGIINGTVNAAPVLDIAPNPTLPTITEDQTTNTGQLVSTLLGTSISDIDQGASEGIAIRSVSVDNGTWQYSLDNGTTWTNFGTISSTQSLLLYPTNRVRFVPDAQNPPFDTSPGSTSFSYVAWDRTGRSSMWYAGGKVSTTSRGGATPFSVNIETASISVTDLNDAPVLTAANPVLSAIRYTETTNSGVDIASLVGTTISDVDVVTAPLEGIAIHTLNSGTGGGYWEYSIDNGTTWTQTGVVSTTSALLLRTQDRIRFQPGVLNTNDNASFGFYAWDQTQNLGQQGTKTNVTTRGGTTAFSTSSDTATIRINAAPDLDPSASPALPTITEDQTTNTGTTVSTLLGGVSDIDVGAARGMALYGLNSSNGTWQYNTGSGWTNIGTVSDTSALLLRASDQIRFIPNAIKGTTAEISFYAWDQTTGTFGTKVNVTSRGSTTAFSVNGDTASILATEVNDTPTLSVTATTLNVTEGNAPTAVYNSLTLADIDDLNLSGATVRITGNYLASEDLLALAPQANISSSWDGTTGTLTLTGTATKAEYQAALRAVSYQNTNANNPNISTRTVTFTITDANSDGTGFGALTASSARPIAITAINDAPTLTTTATSLTFTEGDAATFVDGALSLADVDDTQLTGATVQITGNFLTSEDQLSFTNQLGITGSWNAVLGKLTLSGTASKSDYETALRSVTYQNTNATTPDTSTRTVTFTITDANSASQGSGALNATATRTIAIQSVNDAPTASGSAAPLSYSEGDGLVVVDSAITLSDVDDTQITGAVVQIIGNHHADQDQLLFTDQSGITGTWDATTGTLTLAGTATKANYQAALRSITYLNSLDNPNTSTRTIQFTITDNNSGGLGSGTQSVTIQRDLAISAVNDAPLLSSTVMPLSYQEGDPATVVDAAMTLNDVDDTLMNGATIQIIGNYQASEDLLALTPQANISSSWNATTGTLTLTGIASKADYQAALRAVTYLNSNSDNPNIAIRTIHFAVTDSNSDGAGGGALTTTSGRTIIMSAVNDGPNMTTDAPLAYEEGDPATIIDPGLSLIDVDDNWVVGGMVQISGNYQAGEDLLAFVDQAGITGSWDPVTGTLVLTGAATRANYEAALRTITYQNLDNATPNQSTRSITFSVTDANSDGAGTGSITTQGSRDIVVSSVNDAPVLTGAGAVLTIPEGSAVQIIDATLSLTDIDDAFIQGATVQISHNYLASEDLLAFTNQSGIAGSWNGATGMLTLSGSASRSDYETALRSITYINSNPDHPGVAPRTITFSVTDSNANGTGTGAITTSTSRTLVMQADNDAPGVTTNAVSLSFSESDAATPVDTSLSLTDVDDAWISGATVQITGNYLSSEDQLSLTAQPNISSSWNATTGTLTLSGIASKADYQTALRAVTYLNSNNDNPATGARTITFAVTDSNSNGEGSGARTTTATRSILVHAINDAPGITMSATPLPFNEGDAATAIDPALTLTDVDDGMIHGATVQITGNHLASEDLLSLAVQPAITSSWNAATGTLTLSGTASKADYQAALRAVTYHNSNANDPSNATRTITMAVTDGNSTGQGSGAITTQATRAIQIQPLNDAPTVTGSAINLSLAEGAATTPVDATLSLNDLDDTHLTGATVQITANYQASEDALLFVNQAGITGSWDGTTGMLTLSGAATTAQYQTALRSITYQNSNTDHPIIATRIVTFTVTDNNANTLGLGALSDSHTRSIVIEAINDAPTLTTTVAPLGITEGDGAVVVDGALTLADVDDTQLTGAVVQITAHYQSGEDLLLFSDQSGITGSWDGVLGRLTLSGTASKTNYETALRAITYQNSNTANPDITPRTVTFTITDANSQGEASGSLTSSATRSINLTAINDAPTLTATVTTLNHTEGDGQVAVDSALLLADLDDGNITGATIQIVGNYHSNQDQLDFFNQSGITGSWDLLTGTLTLSGTASKADYQAALRSITYTNGSDNPTVGTRTIQFTITDDNSNGQGSGAQTVAVQRAITVTAVNDTPTLSCTTNALSFPESSAATAVDSAISLDDIDDTMISGARVQITDHYLASEDLLSMTNQAGITASWDGATGTLTLSGTASKADYQTALRSVLYDNTNDNNPSTAMRTVTFSVTDSNSNGQGSGALTISGSRRIIMTAIDDAPNMTNQSALTYTEGNAATSVDAGLSLIDVDDDSIVAGVVQITGNYLASEDRLTFNDQSGITGSWDGATGTLILSGTALKADYEAALRSITYQNLNVDNPSTLTRTISFWVTDGNSNGQGDGAVTTHGSRDIVITAINDAPGITSSASTLTYTEGNTATVVDDSITLSDVDDAIMSGASIQIAGNYLASEDILTFSDQPLITGSWDTITGTLTLSGTATKAEYQAALRSITYTNTNNDNPSTAQRTVTFAITDDNSDGQGSGAITSTATRDLQIQAVNDAPTLSGSATPLTITEGDGATPVDATLSLADVDDSFIVGASVRITGNYLASEDLLSFTDQAGITGSWNSSTGTLTLTGTASKADYESALRSITYTNSNSDRPNLTTRTLTFSVTDANSNGEGSGANTTTTTRQLLIQAINDLPGVTTTAAPLLYTESDSATPIDPALSLADVDDAFISGATVQITGNYLDSEDLLVFADQAGIAGSWNSATGMLTLSGSAAKADYETALRSITYINNNPDNPSTNARTVTFAVTDSNSHGEGTGANTTSATRTILMNAVNDAPGVTTNPAPLLYIEGASAAAVIDSAIALTDVDDPFIQGATIQITQNYHVSEDILSLLVDQPGIVSAWDPTTGILALSGTASKATYEAALRSITYTNSNLENPNLALRTITFSVTDSNSNGAGVGAITTTATRDILLQSVNDAPGVTTNAMALSYTEGDVATPVDTTLSLSDVDDTFISGARVQITGNYLTNEDVLAFTDQAGISGAWDSATGTLTLSGTASIADYQTALRSVTYINANTDHPTLAVRTITFSVTDSNSHGSGSGALTTTATRDLVIQAINDAPGVTTSAFSLTYFEDDGAVPIDSGLSLVDVDDAFIRGASVQITGNYLASEDLLAFVDQSGITGSWNSATGSLTLSGT
ncbi:MAG: DUF4347 domain-containing protein, partial [Magnetococcales bacterium]|nr:DUF4347 domain-containing protein [Magnetococcales bacterium]